MSSSHAGDAAETMLPSLPSPDTESSPKKRSPHRLECMEVWGGNEAVERRTTTTGLDLHVLCDPFGQGEHGGDVFYASSCSSGRITRVMLADVMGHGADSVEAAQVLRDLMRRAVNIYSQKKLVKHMNRSFARLREGGRFASALVISYFQPTGRLSVVNAGHPPPLHYIAAEDRWTLLAKERTRRSDPSRATTSPRNLPLGLLDRVDYERLEIDLAQDDRLLLYTDGLIEAESGRTGEMLDTEGLLRIAASTDPDDPLLARTVYEKLLDWKDGEPIDDDASVISLRPNDGRPALKDEVLAPLRWLRAAATTPR